eukprot:2101178-Pleurochrysis_carterae.AAC.2
MGPNRHTWGAKLATKRRVLDYPNQQELSSRETRVLRALLPDLCILTSGRTSPNTARRSERSAATSSTARSERTARGAELGD